MGADTIGVERWTRLSRASAALAVAVLAVLAAGPLLFSASAADKLTTLFIYVILAVMWNALAGYGGLISVGQQLFFGLGAYAAVRLANSGVSVYPALLLAALITGAASVPLSFFMLRLKGGEFAIGMWVVAETAHLFVNLDTLVQGETGTSLIELNAYDAETRRAFTYLAALAAMAGLLGALFLLLRSRAGAAIQAIRDDEAAAASVGVRVFATKRVIFVLAAFGTAMAGALWLATAISFQPKTYFGIQWTAYMIFMALAGGLGTFEGAILGAVLFFVLETMLGATGVWYLISLGGTALAFSLFLPRGIWGTVEDRFGVRLLPVGYRLRISRGLETQGPRHRQGRQQAGCGFPAQDRTLRARPFPVRQASHGLSIQEEPRSGDGQNCEAGSGFRPLNGTEISMSKDEETPMDVNLIIGGEAAQAEGGATYERRDPVTGAVASRAAAATVADAEKAVQAAATAFSTWSATGPGERQALLLKAADLLEARSGEFVKPMLEEIGATAPWAGFNVMFAASMLREAAALTTQITGEIIPSNKPGTIAMAVRQPAGVVLGMAPWNAPVILGVRAIAAPLACGNTVVLRSSEVCPATHYLIGQILNDAGFPKGVVNVLSNAPADAPKIVEALIAHPAVKRVNFTGSSRVGRIIAVLAAQHLKPVLLELGGKSPLLVLDDADIDQAVDAAAFGAFANQGQICMSTERLVVDETVADSFVAKLGAKASKLPAGDPREHVVLGSLVERTAAERMDELIADAVAKGAVLVCGGKRNGSIVEATILDRVTPEMRIYKEESFGPVKPVVRVHGTDEAVRVANDTEYGLSSAVFGRDIKRAMAVAARIEAGICHINGPTVADEAQMPFGGMKASGYGRFGSKAVIDEFTDLRWITIEGPQHYPF